MKMMHVSLVFCKSGRPVVTKCPGVVDIEFSTSNLDSWGHFTINWCIISYIFEKNPFRRIVDEPETGNVDGSNFFSVVQVAVIWGSFWKKNWPDRKSRTLSGCGRWIELWTALISDPLYIPTIFSNFHDEIGYELSFYEQKLVVPRHARKKVFLS